MDAPVVAAALAEMARGDAHAARARNAPRDANLTNSPGRPGPSPPPPPRAGVSAPRDARGRDHERARSHLLLLTGVLVGVLVSNAAHSTSASGAVHSTSASASETVSDARASIPFTASVWRDVVAGSFGKASERASERFAGAKVISAASLPRSVLAYGDSWFGDAFGRSLIPKLDASSFALGEFSGDDKPATLAEWRKRSSRVVDHESYNYKRTADVLGLANCPRLRVARDVLFGDGAVAELLGVAEFRTKRQSKKPSSEIKTKTKTKTTKTTGTPTLRGDDTQKDVNSDKLDDSSEMERVFVVSVLPLALFFMCPGVVIALRAHELWGLDSVAGAGCVAFGFALAAMWCQGTLELYARWYECPTRRRRFHQRRAARMRARMRRAITVRYTPSRRFADAASESVSELIHAASDFGDTAAFRVWMSRGVYPGVARAAMLEVLGVTSRAPLVVELVKTSLERVLGGGGLKTLFGVVSACFRLEPLTSALLSASTYAESFLTVTGAVCLPLFRVSYRAWYVTSRANGSRRGNDFFARRNEQRARVDDEDDVRSSDDENALSPNDFDAFGIGDWHETPGGDWTALDGTPRSPPSPSTGEYETRPPGVGAPTVPSARRAIGRPAVTAVGQQTVATRDDGAFFDESLDDQPLAARLPDRPGGVPRINPTTPTSRSTSSASHWPEPVRLPEWLDEEKAPRHFRCPITLCVIREPAVTPAGISYERSALMQWLEHSHTEPSTKRRLKRSRVVPNLTLRAMIEDWLADERAERRNRALRSAERSFQRRQEKTEKKEAGGEDGEASTSESERAGSLSGGKQREERGSSLPSVGDFDGADESADGSVERRDSGGDESHAAGRQSSRLRRPGLPARAGAVSQETRDQLRAARQRMYAALKRRAASGVSAEEQRWADLLEQRGVRRRGGAASVDRSAADTSAATTSFSSAETFSRGFPRDEFSSSRLSNDGASSSRHDDVGERNAASRVRGVRDADDSVDDRSSRSVTRESIGALQSADAEDSALDTTIEDVLTLEEDPYL